MNFFRNPNLPDRAVRGVIMSDKLPELCAQLRKNYGTEIISPSPLRSVTGSERFHADMCICHTGGNHFVCDKDNTKLIGKLAGIDAYVEKCEGITAANPLLNACFLGDNVICNIKKTSTQILKKCHESNFRILNVRQSYARCSAAVVSSNALITSDEGIYSLCKKEMIDCLLIPSGNIQLEGYDYGFIGGCCGLIDKDLLVFTGNIKKHPSYLDIKAFSKNFGVYIESLSDLNLYDIGGILPIF